MWLAQAGQPKADANTYTSAGWIAQSIFADAECGEVGVTIGEAVNACIIEEGFAYMVRLVQGIIGLNFSIIICTYSLMQYIVS